MTRADIIYQVLIEAFEMSPAEAAAFSKQYWRFAHSEPNRFSQEQLSDEAADRKLAYCRNDLPSIRAWATKHGWLYGLKDDADSRAN